MAFLFVDRIVELEPGKRGRGRLVTPRGLSSLPPCALAEAVGQLAAWVAMARVEFRRRPVAGIVGETRILRTLDLVEPGTELDLEIGVDSLTEEAIGYHGWAELNGEKLLELDQCVGPMLPIEEFEDPAQARSHFESLLNGGPSKRFTADSLPSLDVTFLEEGSSPKSLVARLDVPESAPFFEDHFPRKPVLPATLLIDVQLRVAAKLASEAAGLNVLERLEETQVHHLKMRAFTPPGTRLILHADVLECGPRVIKIGLLAKRRERILSSSTVEMLLRAVP